MQFRSWLLPGLENNLTSLISLIGVWLGIAPSSCNLPIFVTSLYTGWPDSIIDLILCEKTLGLFKQLQTGLTESLVVCTICQPGTKKKGMSIQVRDQIGSWTASEANKLVNNNLYRTYWSYLALHVVVVTWLVTISDCSFEMKMISNLNRPTLLRRY